MNTEQINPEVPEVQPVPEVPAGKIRCIDGKIIDRADAAFMLREHPKTKNILFDQAGKTYVRDEKGTLRRYPPKVKGKR